MSVSLILPYFNPPVNWSANVVDQLELLTRQITEPIELILVNDGSTSGITISDINYIKDNIRDCVFVSYEENHGKGYAIRRGVEQAKGGIIIYTDIDFPYTIESIYTIYQNLKNTDSDIAMGVKNEAYYKDVPRSRRVISKMLRWMIRSFFTIPFTDTQCGLKGFKMELKPVFLKTTINRYLFDLEFIRNSYKQGFQISAVPVVLNDGIEFRKINYRILLPEVINLMKLFFK